MNNLGMENQGLLYNESYQRTFKRGPKHSQVDSKKKKMFYTFDILIGVVGVILFILGLLISFKKGWSGSGYYDVPSEAKTALFMLAVFAIFTCIIGGFGAYTNWKTLIVTFSILSLMCLSFHIYIVFTIRSVINNSSIHMARSWWDRIDDEVKVTIQDGHSCCGYKNIKDYAVTSTVCPQDIIDAFTNVPDEVRKPANVKKKDSYFRKYSSEISVTTSSGTVTTVDNDNGFPDPNLGAGAAGGAGAGGVAGAGAAGAGGVAGAGAAGAANPGVAGGVADDGDFVDNELRKRQIGQAGQVVDDGIGGGIDGGVDGGLDGGVGGGVGGAMDDPGAAAGIPNGNVGGVAGNANDVGVGQGAANGNMQNPGVPQTDTPHQDISLDGVPEGCETYLAKLVKDKLNMIYMVLLGLGAFYVIGSIMGWLYWNSLRGVKEFDEFA